MHVLYILKTHAKFQTNRMLFTIWFINLILTYKLDYKNSKFKHLINNIIIDLKFFKKFTSMKKIRRKHPIAIRKKLNDTMHYFKKIISLCFIIIFINCYIYINTTIYNIWFAISILLHRCVSCVLTRKELHTIILNIAITTQLLQYTTYI